MAANFLGAAMCRFETLFKSYLSERATQGYAGYMLSYVSWANGVYSEQDDYDAI